MTNLLQFEPSSDKNRAETPAAYKWHINDIYSDDKAWEQGCNATVQLLETVATYQGKLHTEEAILNCLGTVDSINMSIEKIYAYARLQKDADGTDNTAQLLTGRAEVLINKCNNAYAFVEPELLALDPAFLEALTQKDTFKEYHHYFKNLLRERAHVLSIPEETLLAQSTLATGAPEEIFHTLVGADLTFPAAKNSAGEDKAVSEGSYLLNMTSTDRTLRANTFHNLMGVYHQYRNTLAATLNAKARTSLFYAQAHKYADTRTSSLSRDNIPTSVYDGLISTVENKLPALHDYMKFKKDTLKLADFHPYDLYLPLSAQGGDTYHFTFEEAKATVLEALQPLGATYLADLEKGLTSGWIDTYENKGKRSGAYSWGVYGVHPYVLLNFQPRYNSVSTLAHEMGHAMHSFYSSSAQPFPTSDYTIFCAEVASTTNEILLLEYMLKKANKEQKLFLLNQFLEAIRTTVYRQTQFAELEKIFHGEVTAGNTLTADYMEKLWHELNEKYYGPALTIDAALDSEWSRIPHFYTPFYVYKYATGYSAAMAFATNILAGKPGAVEKYLSFLQAGGSDYSLNLLKNAGVDLTTPAPVETTLNKFAEKLEELKKLV